MFRKGENEFMRMYIAEKPSVAGAIAEHIWGKSKARSLKNAHCYQGDDTVVTWSYGHIMRQAMPEEYGEKYKNYSVYPLIPEEWVKLPAEGTIDHFKFIGKLLKSADEVVNCGDSDREGQLLVDEILRHFKYKGKVYRIYPNALDEESLKREFADMFDNRKCFHTYEAGLARERADWLVGMNLSRAYSVNAKRYGLDGWFRVGRVKAPTLALVVQRQREIDGFTMQLYYLLYAKCKKGTEFRALWQPKDTVPADPEGRILKKGILEAVAKKLAGKDAVVTKYEAKKATEQPPLPYSLDKLQVEAGRLHKMSPTDVLDTCQSLYEKKVTTYPRSDCNYIPESQQADATRILPVLRSYGIKGAERANANLKSKAFNDKKISAHHAIIPTGVMPSGLSDNEQKIYEMVATRYILQFYPVCVYDTVKYELEIGDEVFAGSGRRMVEPGFRALYQDVKEDDDKEAEDTSLPALKKGDVIPVNGYDIEERQTHPPKPFTDATLIDAMKNIWRFIPADAKTKTGESLRELLKESKGIGTTATRDTIISQLMENGKKRNDACMVMDKKRVLKPTPFGISLIDNLDPTLTKPEFTAVMEYDLGQIEDGKITLQEYMDNMANFVLENIMFAEKRQFVIQVDPDVPMCPVCHKSPLKRLYSKNTQKYFWICSDDNCKGTDGKTVFYNDLNGKPAIALCPTCGTLLKRLKRKSDGSFFWLCEPCHAFFDDNKGKPVFQKAKAGAKAGVKSATKTGTKSSGTRAKAKK